MLAVDGWSVLEYGTRGRGKFEARVRANTCDSCGDQSKNLKIHLRREKSSPCAVHHPLIARSDGGPEDGWHGAVWVHRIPKETL